MPSWYKYSDRAQFKIVDGKRVKTDEEQHSRIRTVEWLESELNTKLPDADFQLAKLGVTDGTLIHDQLAGVYYRYNPVAKDEPPKAGMGTYFVVANLIIVVGVIAALMWRRRTHAPRRLRNG